MSGCCSAQRGIFISRSIASSLPIVERLQRERLNGFGRSPRCLVLELARELAKQVTTDFLSIKSRFLSIATLNGGREYSRQEASLQRGVDVVVRTPGRIECWTWDFK